MLGLPASPGPLGYTLIALGGVVALVFARVTWRRGPAAAVVCLAVTVGAAPFLVWRIVEDLRFTTAMTAYDRGVAGPVQAYLQPYLLDEVARRMPAGDTYATAVGNAVPYPTARKAFPALAQQSLFPRVSTDPSRADWVVAWGVDPRTVTAVTDVIVARPRSGPNPPVYLARVER
jgi:hypothetical protein